MQNALVAMRAARLASRFGAIEKSAELLPLGRIGRLSLGCAEQALERDVLLMAVTGGIGQLCDAQAGVVVHEPLHHEKEARPHGVEYIDVLLLAGVEEAGVVEACGRCAFANAELSGDECGGRPPFAIAARIRPSSRLDKGLVLGGIIVFFAIVTAELFLAGARRILNRSVVFKRRVS
jgi:hypothetical protein